MDIPVISVGNIVTGGVGKTPLVELLTSYCLQRGKRVGIVSRGYKRQSTGVVVVSDGRSILTDATGGGDEAVQMARKFSGVIVLVAERRVDAAKRAQQYGVDVIIMDDGFQHRYLERDLDIVVLDATIDATREPLLPAGNKREPFGSLRRSHLIVMSHCREGVPEPHWFSLVRRVDGSLVKTRHRVLGIHRALDDAEVNPQAGTVGDVFAFSGIGYHNRFLETLTGEGMTIKGERRFPDHHLYGDQDVRELVAHQRSVDATSLVTTEKDVVRMRAGTEGVRRFLVDENVFYLSIALEIMEGASVLYETVNNVLERKPS
jgi:tetraacyldisaccharide 4'-kinase